MIDSRDSNGFLCSNLPSKSYQTGEPHMHLEAHLTALSEKHQKLDEIILKEEHRPSPDSVILHELKKEKLKLKDEIEKFKRTG